jgi:uncharacterized protein YbbC (DUF1343 family)
LPVRHGLTVGEIARWANDKLGIGCEVFERALIESQGHCSTYIEIVVGTPLCFIIHPGPWFL